MKKENQESRRGEKEIEIDVSPLAQLRTFGHNIMSTLDEASATYASVRAV